MQFAIGSIIGNCQASVSETSPSVTFTITQPPEYRVFQRATTSGGGESKGTGTIPITVEPSEITDIYARLRDATTGDTLQTIQIATDAAAEETSFDIDGVNARLGWFFIDIGPSASGPWTNGTNRVGMGAVTFLSGQSLAVRAFGTMDGTTNEGTSVTDAGSTIPANGSVYAIYVDGQRTVSSPSWQLVSNATGKTDDYDSAFAAEYIGLQSAALGVNVAFTGFAEGAQRLDQINGKTGLTDVLGALDGFETSVLIHGHSDAAAGTSNAAYQAKIDAHDAILVANNDVLGSSFTRVLSPICNIQSSSWGTPAQINTIRQAMQDWADTNSQIYTLPIDIELIDGVHQSQVGNVRYAQQIFLATLADYEADDAQPVLASGTRATDSADIVLSATLAANASALSEVGDSELRFDVFDDGDTSTPYTISSASVSGSNITLTLSSAPANDQALDVYFGYPLDPDFEGQNEVIYDNSVYSGMDVGRQLTATLAPIDIAAPGGGGGSTPVGPDLVDDGTPVYVASPSGFGQQFQGNGTANFLKSTDTALVNMPASLTVEAFITPDGGGTQVALGVGDGWWIGTSGTSWIYAYRTPGDTGVITTGVSFTPGQRYHVALVLDGGNEARFYVDGTLVHTNAAAPAASNSANQFAIGRLGTAGFDFSGEVDDVALYYGTALHSSDFTPTAATLSASTSDLTAKYDLDGNGNAATIGADTTPDAFTFTDLTGQTVSTTVQSNTITVAGIDSDATISISGDASAEYRINAGSWTSSSGTVSNGDDVQLQIDTSASNSTAVTATLNIGGVTDEWSVTTEAASGSSIGPDLTEQSATYGTGDTGFGQALTGGYAKSASATDVMPDSNLWTVELRFKGTDTGNNMLTGQGGKIWIACDNGNIRGNYAGVGNTDPSYSAGTTGLNDGNWHHVAFIADETEIRVYVDGVLELTQNSTAPKDGNNDGTANFRIRNFIGFGSNFDIDEVAVWNIAKYSGASFTSPTSPYVGDETGLVALYHLDGDADAATV